jgi:hypothetical protein
MFGYLFELHRNLEPVANESLCKINLREGKKTALEPWPRDLRNKRLRRAKFAGVRELGGDMEYSNHYTAPLNSFTWRAEAGNVLAEIERSCTFLYIRNTFFSLRANLAPIINVVKRKKCNTGAENKIT